MPSGKVRDMAQGQKSRLSDPEVAKAVAEAYINGVSRTEMAEIFGVHKDTITIWTRDPRVLAHGGRFAQERVARISRLIDKEVEERLEDIDELDIEQLLKIRKEYIERVVKFENTSAETTSTVNDTVKAIEENPEIAEALLKMVNGGS